MSETRKQISLRMPRELFERVERILEHYEEQAEGDPLRGVPTRSDVLVEAISRGVDSLEDELSIDG